MDVIQLTVQHYSIYMSVETETTTLRVEIKLCKELQNTAIDTSKLG